jgi:hypothetical protein
MRARLLTLVATGAVVLCVYSAPASADAARESSTPATTTPYTGLVPASKDLSARLVIPDRATKAGTTLTGELVITNKSKQPIDLVGPDQCEPRFAVVLTNKQIPPEVAFAKDCVGARFTVAPGQHRFLFGVITSYQGCSAAPPTTVPPDMPGCVGPHGTAVPPLPAGKYHAVLVGNGNLALPEPNPVKIRLT